MDGVSGAVASASTALSSASTAQSVAVSVLANTEEFQKQVVSDLFASLGLGSSVNTTA